VLTDVMLPTGDGIDILVYALAQRPSARVIVMTAFGSEATRRRSMDLGRMDYQANPLTLRHENL
jgi:DNA-binding response OmpR family regulator